MLRGRDRPVRVAVVENHPIVSRSLMSLLGEAGFRTVATVTSVEDLPKSSDPDVVLCDLHLPGGLSGAPAVELLIRHGWPVLAMSGVANQEAVLDAVAAGARGFVEKSEEPSVFVAAVAAVASDGCHISARLAGYLLDDVRARPLPTGEIGPRHLRVLRSLAQGDTSQEVGREWGMAGTDVTELEAAVLDAARRRRRRYRPSPRERQVMILLACEGSSRNEIAERLHITPWTVTSILENIRDKYVRLHPEAQGIRPGSAARLWALRLGMCDEGERAV